MADQGKTVISMTVPESTGRGRIISGAGTLDAALKGTGVLYEPSDAGQTLGQVQVAGTCPVVLGETLTAGAICRSDADGAAVATAGDGSDDFLACVLLLEGGDADELVEAKII